MAENVNNKLQPLETTVYKLTLCNTYNNNLLIYYKRQNKRMTVITDDKVCTSITNDKQ